MSEGPFRRVTCLFRIVFGRLARWEALCEGGMEGGMPNSFFFVRLVTHRPDFAMTMTPEEQATMPPGKDMGSTCAILLKAPRNLKAPTRCRFSALSRMCPPVTASSAGCHSNGVRTA